MEIEGVILDFANLLSKDPTGNFEYFLGGWSQKADFLLQVQQVCSTSPYN